MRFIDKSGNAIEGNKLVDELLREAWDQTESHYVGADYNGLNARKYREKLLRLLLQEQENRCCYCMRLITIDDSTIEHLIPQKVIKSSFASYLVTEELRDHVMHKDDFIRNQRLISPVKYPHDIAYNNLIASCKSREHCNNFRGSKDIEPFVYDKEIGEIAVYDAGGLIDCDQYKTSFDNLGLNSHNLRLIRKTWRRVSPLAGNYENLTQNKIEELLYELTDDPDYIQMIESFTQGPHTELQEYTWFCSYYRDAEGIE